MVVVVPRGDNEDPTRDPAYYDETFDYLKGGVPLDVEIGKGRSAGS